MNNSFLSFFCFFAFLNNSFSQSFSKTLQDSVVVKKSHLFTFCTGYSYHILKDDVISPDIYSGSQAPLMFHYQYWGANSRQTFSLFYNAIGLKSAIPDLSNHLYHYTDNEYVSLEYSYNKRMYNLPKYKVQCFLGGKFKSIYNFRMHYYSENMSEFNFEQISSLGFNILLEKRFLSGRDILHFNFNMPIIAYSVYNNIFSEKSYLNQIININNSKIDIWQIFKKGEFITLNKFIELQTELSYTKFITKRIGLELLYGFNFYSFCQYKHLLHSKYLNSQLLIGLAVKI